MKVSGQNVQYHFKNFYRCLDESGHLLESVRPASDWSTAGVATVASQSVVGDPLAVTVITDDVTLHGDHRNVRDY